MGVMVMRFVKSYRKSIILICSLIILLLAAATIAFSLKPQPEAETTLEIRDLEFEYVGSCWYDPVSAFPWRDFSADVLYTWFTQVRSEEDLNIELKRKELSFSESIDFSESSVIIAFGREILDMECSYLGPTRGRAPFLILTFSEHHDAEKAYFYTTENGGFAPGFIIAHCYILKDGKSVRVSSTIEGMNKTAEELTVLFESEFPILLR